MIVRKPNFEFPKTIKQHWLDDCAFRTHLCNSFTLLFPTGEKFFVRSLSRFVPQITDPKLKAEAKIFMQQETQHFIEHEKFIQNLRDQGYEVDQTLRLVEDVITRFVEKSTSAEFRLSLTAGFEHLTSLLAEIGLSENFFEKSDPVMKKLFEWHAIEEIEHRAVAFDVLQATNPNYANRVAGLLAGYLILSGLVGLVTTHLLWQDRVLFKKKTIKTALDVFFLKNALFPKAITIFSRYLHPSFHPQDEDLNYLVSLTEMSWAEGVA
jgi:uncharacterized protein